MLAFQLLQPLPVVRDELADGRCAIGTARDDLLIIDDPYGIRWEVSTASELISTGDRAGLWLDLPAANRAPDRPACPARRRQRTSRKPQTNGAG